MHPNFLTAFTLCIFSAFFFFYGDFGDAALMMTSTEKVAYDMPRLAKSVDASKPNTGPRRRRSQIASRVLPRMRASAGRASPWVR